MATERDNTNNSKKIGKVLQKFLEPNFKIRNDVYLNLFLTHLVGKDDKEKKLQNEKNQHLNEQFCQWIIEASTLWEKGKVKPRATILAFALNLASQLSTDEQVFVKLNCQNVYESLVGVTQTDSGNDPTVTLGLVTLLCSFLEHKSGLQWVMATAHWIDMINLGLRAHTMYIRKKAYHFVEKLLEKTIGFNRNFATSVVAILLKPLKDGLRSLPNSRNAGNTQIENRELYETLKPHLDFVLEVTDSLLRSCNRAVLQLFIELHTPEVIEKYLLLSRGEDFSFILVQIQFVFLFHKLCGKVVGVKAVDHDSLTLLDCKVMFDLIKNEMDKNNVRSVIKICHYAHDLFCSLSHRMPMVMKKGSTIEFQIQLIFLQLTPIFGFTIQIRTKATTIYLLLNDVFRNTFFLRWLKISAVQSIELCYKWAEKLKDRPHLVDDVIFCFQYISKMKKLLNKERAAIIFPALVYSLSDALTTLKEGPRLELSNSCLLYFKTIVETIVDLVESFDLTWKDSIETICVMDYAYDFLQFPDWNDSMIIIKGLKLLNTAISKYMSPDMVLLIYHKEDSKISQTGSLLYTKCHDSFWEIRDSALEVVYTLSLNANTKFPAYTNILLNSELPQLVVEMAFKDGESYVRATAFKCLQELIQIQEVWNKISDTNKFVDNILEVFANETEGIVRKEAATLIFKIDKFQGFPEDMLSRVYDVMTHATIGDLHWEVKFNALDFWFNIWEQHLIHQGMIDHTFPSHTFSKEHKKIVALNQVEVRKRIIKVLNQLAHIGCLHVMECSVKDDCDIQVSKKATDFTFAMLKMFKTYRVNSENVDFSQPPSPIILPNSVQNKSPIEPITPVSVSTPASPYPAELCQVNMETMESPQFSNSPFFDPVSPIAAPYSPLLDYDLITPPKSSSQSTSESSPNTSTQNSSPQSQSQYRNYQQSSPSVTAQLYTPGASVQTSPNPTTQFTTPISNVFQQTSPFTTLQSSPHISNMYNASPSSLNNSPSNQIAPASNTTDGMGFSYGDENFDPAELEDVVNSNSLDPVQRERLLEEFLNSNDVTLLQGIYNPTDTVTNNTTQMKTKKYLAPSEYLKFVYNEVETHAMEKTQWLSSLDEFNSLLDDILKEYNISDVNSMDCY